MVRQRNKSMVSEYRAKKQSLQNTDPQAQAMIQASATQGKGAVIFLN